MTEGRFPVNVHAWVTGSYTSALLRNGGPVDRWENSAHRSVVVLHIARTAINARTPHAAEQTSAISTEPRRPR